MAVQELKPLFTSGELAKASREEIIEKCFQHYHEDFGKEPVMVKGKRVKVISSLSGIPGFEKYPETFAHIATREIKSQRERFFEVERAIRVNWIKPILTSNPTKAILYFKWKDERNLCKEYYWFFSGKFMVVVKEVSPDLQIVTAFCVDKEEEIKYFEWYNDYKDGKSNCQK